MKNAHSIFAVAALTACQGGWSVGEAAKAPPAVAAPASAIPAPVLASTPVTAPALGLSVVIEGPCRELGARFFDNATLVHYGHVRDGRFDGLAGVPPTDESRLVLAFVRDDGSVVEDVALARGLPASHTPELDLGDVKGTWPDRAALRLYSHGGERVSAESDPYVWKGDQWVSGRLPENAAASGWVSGSSWLSGTHLELAREYADSPSFRVVPPGAAPTPDFTALHVAGKTGCAFQPSGIVTRPTGEVLLAGTFCGIFPVHGQGLVESVAGAPVARWTGPVDIGMTVGEDAVARWVPGGRATIEKIPPVPNHADLQLNGFVETSPTSLYLFGTVGTDAYIAFHDGASWSRVETPFKGYVAHRELAPDGTLWVLTSRDELYARLPSGGWAREPLDPVTDVAWVGGAPAWAVAEHKIMRRANGSWSEIALPRPAFTATDTTFAAKTVSVSPRGEVWVKASYEERRPEWTVSEEREALLLLRAGPLPRATRCEATKGTSFSRWPSPATPACTDLVAILARVSKSAPASYDFPQTRAALRGHDEVSGAELVEIEIDGKRLLAAKVKSMEMGKRLVELEGRGVRGARPELVCATPKVTRALAFDVVSGKLQPTSKAPPDAGRAGPE